MGYQVDPNADQMPEGWHLFEIKSCEDKVSKKGDGMFVVNMSDVDTGRFHRERWMMQGKGQGMTVPKLRALGVDMGKPVEAIDLVGRRFFGEIRMSKPKPDSQYGPELQIKNVRDENNTPDDYNPGAVIPFNDTKPDTDDSPW